MIEYKITSGNEILNSGTLILSSGNRADYLGELKRKADSLTSGIEVILWLKFGNAKQYALYSYVTGTKEAYYMGGAE